MGKLYHVKDRNGIPIANIAHPIDFAPYFHTIAKKYKIDYTYGKDNLILLQEKSVNEQDKLIINIFLNDRNMFTRKDITTFESCINEYPSHTSSSPKDVLVKYCWLLICHHEIHTEFAGVLSQNK